MTQQLSLDRFFSKSKRHVSKQSQTFDQQAMVDIDIMKRGKRKLSLKKEITPIKSPKVDNVSVEDVISLVSDDEDIWGTSPRLWESSLQLQGPDSEELARNYLLSDTHPPNVQKQSKAQLELNNIKTENQWPDNEELALNCLLSDTKPPNIQNHSNIQIDLNSIKTENNNDSDSTISYTLTPPTPRKPPLTPKSALTQTPQSPNIQHVSSPPSRNKYFSPSKKRSVPIRPPPKVKRNLNSDIFNSQPSTSSFEDLFKDACEGMDDKTVFLLKTIHGYLIDNSLRCLLDISAQTLLAKCFEVVKPGMKLVCRLYWRKEAWYKRLPAAQLCFDKFDELNEPCLQAMLDSLLENGLIVQGGPELTIDELTTVLNLEELRQICKDLKLKTQTQKKVDVINALRNFSECKSICSYFTGHTSNNSMRLLKIMSDKTGPLYKLSDLARKTIYKLNVLMYLGMDYNVIRGKKLELILLYDKINRETYPIDKNMELDNASVVFRNQDDFDRYMKAHYIYEEFLVNSDLPDKCDTVKRVFQLYKEIGHIEMAHYQSLPPWLYRYTPASLYIKIMEAGIEDLKKCKTEDNYLTALDILSILIDQNTFRQHKKADWYAEKALILHRILKQYDEAAEVLLTGFKSNMSEELKDIMRKKACILARQKNIQLSPHLKEELLEYGTRENVLEKNLERKHIEKQPMERTQKRGKVVFESFTQEGRMFAEAEEYCISQYLVTKEYTDGEHWEGRIIVTIFFLLFWDIIYQKPVGVRGIFLSYYQKTPLDLFCKEFYKNRQAAVDIWLEVIEKADEAKLLRMMIDVWDKRPESEQSLINRSSVTWTQVRHVASCLGGRGLAAICSRLVKDFRYTNSGFPDLTLWNKYSKKIKFVEVKTDTDQPSMKQIQWMHYLTEHNIDTEFCYIGVNTTRQRSRANNPAPKQRKPKTRIPKEKAKSDVKTETS